MGMWGYPVRDVITAVRWIQMTLVTTGSIWKGLCLPLVKATMMQCRELPTSVATVKHLSLRCSYQIDVQNCLQLLRALKPIRAFLFLFRNGCCVPTNIKSIGELVTYGVQQWETRSFILPSKIYVTKEWTKLWWHTFSNIHCFVKIIPTIVVNLWVWVRSSLALTLGLQLIFKQRDIYRPIYNLIHY